MSGADDGSGTSDPRDPYDSDPHDSDPRDSDSRDSDSSDPGSFDPNSLSDADIEAELERFQQELEKGVPFGRADGIPSAGSDESSHPSHAGEPGTSDRPESVGHAQRADDATESGAGGATEPDDAMGPAIGGAANFEDELQGLLGNKAKIAMLITRLASAELLSAFCRMAQVDADCMDGEQGAMAVLRDLDGDAPETAAEDITSVVSGMAVVLAVNRADKLQATLYLGGQAGQDFAPPLLFTSTAPVVEDLMLGICSIDDLRSQGASLKRSMDLDEEAAMSIIAANTHHRRGSDPHRE